MDQINRWLWIGDAQDGRDHAKIVANHIGAVWNATQESDGWPTDVRRLVAYHRANLADGEPIPFPVLDEFAAWQAVQGHHGRTILSQCGAGVSRSATFAVLALILASGMVDWDACLEMVRAVRPQANPHPALKDSVLRWYGVRDGLACHQPKVE